MYNRTLPSWIHYVIIVVLVVAGLYGVTRYFEPTIDAVKARVAEYADRELRVPPYDMVVYLPLHLERIQQTQFERPTIGMFGASTVYGTTVSKGENTSAGVFQSHLPEYQLLNLGLTGARFTETYAVLASVVDKMDYVVYEINYGIVSASDNEEEVIVYPSLYQKMGQYIPLEWLDPFPEKDGSVIPSKAHQWVVRNVLNRWSLYHDRDVLVYERYKTRTGKEKLRREYQGWLDERLGTKEPGYSILTPFEKLSDKVQAKIVAHYRDLYSWKQPFDPDHSFGMTMIDQTLKLLQANGKKAVFYSAPLDLELIERESLIDWDRYREVMSSYKAMIESYGYTWIDFNLDGQPLIDHAYYHDPSHMVDEGNRQFGEILYEAVREELGLR